MYDEYLQFMEYWSGKSRQAAMIGWLIEIEIDPQVVDILLIVLVNFKAEMQKNLLFSVYCNWNILGFLRQKIWRCDHNREPERDHFSLIYGQLIEKIISRFNK